MPLKCHDLKAPLKHLLKTANRHRKRKMPLSTGINSKIHLYYILVPSGESAVGFFLLSRFRSRCYIVLLFICCCFSLLLYLCEFLLSKLCYTVPRAHWRDCINIIISFLGTVLSLEKICFTTIKYLASNHYCQILRVKSLLSNTARQVTTVKYCASNHCRFRGNF